MHRDHARSGLRPPGFDVPDHARQVEEAGGDFASGRSHQAVTSSIPGHERRTHGGPAAWRR